MPETKSLGLHEGMIVTLKKKHPCGSNQWKILRTGADVKMECLGCAHVLILPRYKLRKMIKQIAFDERST